MRDGPHPPEPSADWPRLPAPLTARQYRGTADHEPMFRLLRTAVEADDDLDDLDREAFEDTIRHPSGWTPERDVVLIEDGDGLVAWGRTQIVEMPTAVNLRHRGYVHPAWQGRGVGSAMLAHHERVLATRARAELDSAALAANGRTTRYATWVGGSQARARRMLEANGYATFHGFQTMVLPADAVLPAARPVAAGVIIRAIRDDEAEAFVRTMSAGFADTDVARLMDPVVGAREMLDSSGRLPEVGLAAFADGEMVAVVHPERWSDGTAEISEIAVLPAWRRRGIAWALLREGVAALRAAGAGDVRLSVETVGQQAAVRLYEAFGFGATSIGIGYGKPFAF
jgi:ribosomal protein S18 acetylase RimI-like enzyme